jgi:hypothetical protein
VSKRSALRKTISPLIRPADVPRLSPIGSLAFLWRSITLSPRKKQIDSLRNVLDVMGFQGWKKLALDGSKKTRRVYS